MTTPARRPVVAVLCETAEDRPSLPSDLDDDLDLRFTDAAGLSDAVDGAEALLLWDFFSTAVRGVWAEARSVRWIHVAAAGVDTLLFDELVESDVVVTNARGVFDRPIAEFVLTYVLAHAKGVATSLDDQQQRIWRHREPESIAGANTLVVGTGAIGREIGRLLAAVGMNVRGAGRTARTDDADFEQVVASRELVEHVGWADHVVVAAPLTPQTRGLVGSDVLTAMKPTAHLVNIGRGPIVDEAALIDAMNAGAIAGASLDVVVTEPLPPDSPLWTLPGVLITAHMSGDVVGWRDMLARQFVDNARRWLAGEPLRNVVNKPLGFVEGP